ncbi:MAG: Ig-like domain-containing protein, partial [Inhella sp.]
TLVYTVSLSGSSSVATTHAFSLGGGTASAGDFGTPTFTNGVTYNAATGTITVPPGVTSFAVNVPTTQDSADEANETVPLTIGGVSGTGTIVDDDAAPALSVNDVTVNEAAGTVTFTVSLSSATGQTVTVNYGTANGTATAGSDYSARSGALTFAPGTTTQTVTVALTDDNLAEGSETFRLVLTSPTNATIAQGTGTATVLDNDGAPSIASVSSPSATEGADLVFDVALSNPSTSATTFAFSLGGGTAVAADHGSPSFSNGVTYNAATGNITVPAGVTSFSVTVGTTQDSTSEPTETLPLSVGGVSGTGSILDDDGASSIASVSSPSATEGNDLVFDVVLTNPSATDTTHSFNLGGGSATAGDFGTPSFTNGVTYNAATGTITVPAGVTSFSVTVPTTADTRTESTETVPLSVGTVTGTGSIVDNDAPPTGTDATVTLAEDSSHAFSAASFGFTATDGDTLAAVRIDTLPGAGSLTLNGNPVTAGQVIAAADLANLVFTPAANANGNGYAAFTFSVQDSSGDWDAAPNTLTLDVTPVNDAPVANADTASTPINTAVNNIAVLANDTDVDGNPLSVTGATLANPALGTVTVNPDGTLNFTPATNVTGPVVVNYTISDGQGGSATGTLTVNVGSNTPPTGTDATVTLPEDGSHAFSAASFGFADADAGQTLAAVRIDTLPGAGTLSLTGTPVVAGQVINAADLANLVFTPAANAHGTGYASFTFSVQDSSGAFDTAPNTITLNVTPVADPAVLGGVSSGATVEDSTTSASGQLTIVDPDTGEAVFVPQTNVAGAHGTFSVTAAGLWTYTLNNADPAVQALGAGQALPAETFTVTSADGSSITVTVSITGTNDAPVAADATASATEGGPVVTGAVTATDTDANAVLSFSLNGPAPAGLTFNANGTYSFNPADPAYNDLAAGQTRTITVPYTVTDDQGATSIATLTITITGTNDAAVVTGVATGSVTEDGTVLASGTLVVSDVDSATTVVPGSVAGTYGDFTINAAGQWTYTLRNGDANVQALTSADAPVESFTVTTADGTTSTVTVTVNGANEAPTVSVTPASGTEDSAGIPISLSGADVDGSVASFTIGSLPANGTLWFAGSPVTLGQVIPATANAAGLSFVPNANWNGSTSFTFTATDNEGASSTPATQTISVSAVNDDPVTQGETLSTPEDTPLTVTVASLLANDSDVEGNTLSITAVSGAVNGSVALVGGNVVFTPAANFSGTASFTYTVSDGQGGLTNAVATVQVLAVPDAPTLTLVATPATVVFQNSWESSPNPDTRSTVHTVTTLEGWTRVDSRPGELAGGINAFETWTLGDTQARHDGAFIPVNVAPGNGDTYLELNDSSSLGQTLGISRSVSTEAGKIYELSFDYAGRPSYAEGFTRIGIYIDGVLAQQYSSTSPQSAADWKNLVFRFAGDGGSHTITIRTDATAVDPFGRGAFIDDMRMTAVQGVMAGNGGTYTAFSLSSYVSGALTDTDGSESLSYTFTGLAAGALIVTASQPLGYSPVGGSITLSAAELATAELRLPTSVTGDLVIGVRATSTEASTGASSSVDGVLTLHVGSPWTVTDIADVTGAVSGTTGADTLTGANASNVLFGRAGDDVLTGGNGADVLDGGPGNDGLNGGNGADLLIGGTGNDVLTGGLGADVFRWTLADRGSAGSPALDTLTDFDASAGGDVLDLRDLLQGEALGAGNTPGNLSQYLDFQYDAATGNTIVRISSTGGFAQGAYNASAEDQRITLQGIDLRTALGLASNATDDQILQELLHRGKLGVGP